MRISYNIIGMNVLLKLFSFSPLFFPVYVEYSKYKSINHVSVFSYLNYLIKKINIIINR